MPQKAVFTMKIEAELRDAFIAAAKYADRPASEVVQDFMRDYVQQHREYVEFLRKNVERSSAEISAGRFFTQEEVEADVRRRFAEWERKSPEAGG